MNKKLLLNFQKGLLLHQQGQLVHAKEIYEQVLKQQPEYFDALHMLGVIAVQSRNFELSLELIGNAIAVNSKNAIAHSNLGITLKELGRAEEALVSCDKAVELAPSYAEAYSNRGAALRALNRFEEALSSYDRAIEIEPNDAKFHSNRGNVLKELGRMEEALASYKRAIEIRPEYALGYSNYGLALVALDRIEEALACYDRAIELQPQYVDAYFNRGNAFLAALKIQAALSSYDRAIALSPDYVEAYWNKANALLLSGDFNQGWPLYEWRWKSKSTELKLRPYIQPLWLGKQDIKGKTVLLYAEQGLGDTLQFCRYAKLVKERGARVVMEFPKTLKGLLEGLEGVDTWVEAGQALPAFDYHCPLLSLPLALGIRLESIPNPGAYLKALPTKREAWANKLGPKTKPRVGLVWSGNSHHKNDHNRSLNLQALLPHFPEGFEYVSLQKEVRETDAQALKDSAIKHYGETLEDFTDTAALCELMDVVISVDTSVAHLAGALGKPTWVLLSYVPDWRWLLDREDSPWYASVKLYRQGAEREWASVLQRVGTDLRGQRWS